MNEPPVQFSVSLVYQHRKKLKKKRISSLFSMEHKVSGLFKVSMQTKDSHSMKCILIVKRAAGPTTGKRKLTTLLFPSSWA